MVLLTRLAISVAIVTVCSNAACAAKAPLGAEDSARTRLGRVVASQTEFAQESVVKENDGALLAGAQVNFDASVSQSAAAHENSNRLLGNASELRRIAYTLTDQPGLSALENQKMLAAMEAADAAESEARVAQTYGRLAVAAVIANHQAVAKLTGRIAALQQRMDACTAIIRPKATPCRLGCKRRNSIRRSFRTAAKPSAHRTAGPRTAPDEGEWERRWSVWRTFSSTSVFATR
jgi:hypothetical protein